MNRTPVVGLTLHAEARDGVPRRFIRNRAYFSALESAGAAVLAMPASAPSAALRALYERCDALCIPGGPDVEPGQYGEQERDDCNVHADAELDGAELQLLSWAGADRKPVLAICRGMQVLNVALGGSLWQDLRTQVPGALEHRHEEVRDELVHVIEIEPGSCLHRVTGATRVRVNSLHHQGVNRIAAGLRVTARAPDGVVEALEDPSHPFLVGVQCHPEELTATEAWTRRLFSGFIAAAGG